MAVISDPFPVTLLEHQTSSAPQKVCVCHKITILTIINIGIIIHATMTVCAKTLHMLSHHLFHLLFHHLCHHHPLLLRFQVHHLCLNAISFSHLRPCHFHRRRHSRIRSSCLIATPICFSCSKTFSLILVLAFNTSPHSAPCDEQDDHSISIRSPSWERTYRAHTAAQVMSLSCSGRFYNDLRFLAFAICVVLFLNVMLLLPNYSHQQCLMSRRQQTQHFIFVCAPNYSSP